MSSYFDASPKTLIEVNRLLKNEDGILRFFTLKKQTSDERVNAKNYKNPYKTATPVIEELD